jgi:hypothetical protein
MITRAGGIVLTLKKGNRVEIKLAVWPCGSFHRLLQRTTAVIQQTFRNMNRATPKMRISLP